MTRRILLADDELRAKEEFLKQNPPQRAAGNLTSQQFFVLLHYLLEVEQPDLEYHPAYPKYLVPDSKEFQGWRDNPTEKFKDTITFQITRQEPGSVGGDKQPFGDTREVVPRLRESRINATTNKEERVYGQWLDTLVQFDVWTLTNYEADALAIWFHRFMVRYRDYMKHMGLSEILFWWRGRDDVSTKLRNGLHKRTLVFYVRFEELINTDDSVLKEMQFEVTKTITKELELKEE